MKEDSLSTKDMLVNITYLRNNAQRLLQNGKVYVPLLKYILTQRFESNLQVPPLKEISKKSGVPYDKVRKYINLIYNDLVFDVDSPPTFTLSNVVYEFHIRGWDKEKAIVAKCYNLPVVPRVGENITLPYFTAYLNTSFFFVEEIDYEFDEDKQVVLLYLQPGKYNSYWHHRKHKAIEENEIDIFDLHKLTDYELKEILKVGLRNRLNR